MRKGIIITIAAALLVGQKLMAQTFDETQAVAKLQELLDKSGEVSKAGDYTGAISCMEEAWAVYEAAPEEFKQKYDGVTSGLHYNLACYNSLAGNLPEALVAFEKAVDDGWSEYSHVLNDSDLDNIRNMPRFAELLETVRERGDFTGILGKAGGYVPHAGEEELPPFTYQTPDDPDLVKVREYFDLDSIAGSGDEISRILNLLRWAHNVVRHDGLSYNPESKNAIDLVEICRREERGINCRMMAQMLNECYLALGFKSRYVTCMPKVYVDDCHVINTVYSETLGKWLWVDPTFNAWITDENGTMLGIGEVRERLRTGAPLTLNEDANWNNSAPQTKEHYLDYYMAKNLYYVVSPLHSVSDSETAGKREKPVFVALLPDGYSPENFSGIETYDDEYFWQQPRFTK